MRSAIRTALVLGRVSNLPTVWSNLLAGWLLGGGGAKMVPLLALMAGGSLLYVAGMYLNDFFDADFDRRYRPERPIPSGTITRRVAGSVGATLLIAGFLILASLGTTPAALAIVLGACVCFYDAFHKQMQGAPLVMAACRFLLYPLAASAVPARMETHVFLPAAALAAYVAGITFLARGESRPQKTGRWALLLLLAPAALLMGQGEAAPAAAKISLALFAAWLTWLVGPLWLGTRPSVGRAVSGLLAGIVLVDMLAITPVAGMNSLYLLPLMILALLLQRVIPAT